MLSAREIVRETRARAFKSDPLINLPEWSDRFRIMPKGYSEPGPYRTSRTPYLREIMLCLSPSSPVRHIKVMKPTQIGLTETANNWICFLMHLYPCPILFVFPTIALAEKHSKKKLMKTIRETPVLCNLIKEGGRNSGNTILFKEFPGGSINLVGANSAASFRSDSVKVVIRDDFDGYPSDVDGEGDPGDLAINRADAYYDSKILTMSTPGGNKKTSRIAAEYSESDQREYHVPCPLCKKAQTLEWGGRDSDHGIKFEYKGNTVSRIWYGCKFCHGEIDEHHKTWMLEQGVWIPKNPGHPDAGFYLNSLYAPLGFIAWKAIANEFLRARKNISRLKRWVNTRQGLPFDEDGSQPDWAILKARAEPYKTLEVPVGGLLLTCGVDTQDNRLAVLVVAWGRGEECWIVYWGELFGDPGQTDVWRQLDEILLKSYRHASGVELYIASALQDSGGHHTQDVYNYCRTRSPRMVAAKSMSTPSKPILGRPTLQDITYRGTVIKNGAQLWPVGADTAKSQIYSRLRMDKPGPGMVHFPIGLDDDFYVQLTAEKQVTRFDKGGYPKSEWVKIAERNEVLDCFVLATAAAVRAGIARMNWRAIEEGLSVIHREKSVDACKKAQPVVKSKWMS